VTRKLKEFAKMCCACNTSAKLALLTSVTTSHITCALVTMIILFGSWSIAVFIVSWLIWSQQSHRTCFRWSTSWIFWRQNICCKAPHSEQ